MVVEMAVRVFWAEEEGGETRVVGGEGGRARAVGEEGEGGAKEEEEGKGGGREVLEMKLDFFLDMPQRTALVKADCT
jgi:hypothetical protein